MLGPTTTTRPAGSTATSKAKPPDPPAGDRTNPSPENVGSGTPLGVSRATPNSTSIPTALRPTTTTRPAASGAAASPASLAPAARSNATFPPVPKVGSSAPAAVSRATAN